MEFIKNNLLLIILGVIAVVLLIILLILFLKRGQKNKKPQPILDEGILKSIYESLGLNNVISLSKEQDRIKLTLNDVKLVKTEVFTTNNIPVFLKGKELTILFRNFSDNLFKYINEQIGNN